MITNAALPVRRLIIAGGFALAAMAPMAAIAGAVPPGHVAAACPNGEDNDFYTGSCVPYLVPNSPAAPQPAANTCPPGVTGAECGVSTGNEAKPQVEVPNQPDQTLQNVSTPDY